VKQLSTAEIAEHAEKHTHENSLRTLGSPRLNVI